METLSDAVRFLEAGDWQAAHRIVQDDPGPLASWAHGIVHLIEGDLGNAGYWYGKAGRSVPNPKQIGEEISALGKHLREASPDDRTTPGS